MPNSYTEELSAGDLTVQMTWLDLQAPMAIEVGPDASATKEHDMYAVFLEANNAQISINGISIARSGCEPAIFWPDNEHRVPGTI